jgi:hypothetical protein
MIEYNPQEIKFAFTGCMSDGTANGILVIDESLDSHLILGLDENVLENCNNVLQKLGKDFAKEEANCNGEQEFLFEDRFNRAEVEEKLTYEFWRYRPSFDSYESMAYHKERRAEKVALLKEMYGEQLGGLFDELRNGGTEIIGIKPNEGMTITIGEDGKMDINGGIVLTKDDNEKEEKENGRN